MDNSLRLDAAGLSVIKTEHNPADLSDSGSYTLIFNCKCMPVSPSPLLQNAKFFSHCLLITIFIRRVIRRLTRLYPFAGQVNLRADVKKMRSRWILYETLFEN